MAAQVHFPLFISLFSPFLFFQQYCGRCVKMTNSNKVSIVVRIINQCPECEETHFDLSPDAFKKLGPLDLGVIPITYDFVPCETKGNIKYSVPAGSNKWWSSYVVNNHRVGVKKLEIKGQNIGWTDVARKDYNEFVFDKIVGGELVLAFSGNRTGLLLSIL